MNETFFCIIPWLILLYLGLHRVLMHPINQRYQRALNHLLAKEIARQIYEKTHPKLVLDNRYHPDDAQGQFMLTSTMEAFEQLLEKKMRKMMLREPTHPGIFLKEDYMVPLGLSQAKIAQLLHVDKRTIHDLCNKRRGISADMALKLEKLFGTEAQFWINAQNSYDVWLLGRNLKN